MSKNKTPILTEDELAEYRALVEKDVEDASRRGTLGEMTKGLAGLGSSALVGGVHGVLHGWSDDAERQFFSKADPVTGKKEARAHINAKAAHPTVFMLSQLLGTAATGYGIRAGLPKAGAARAAGIRSGGGINAYGTSSINAAREAQALKAEKFWGQLGIKSPRGRAIALDAGHGAAWGGGGFGVDKDEGLNIDRVQRTLAGAGAGVVGAPLAAGGGMLATNIPLAWGGRRFGSPAMLEPPGIRPPNHIANLVRRMKGQPIDPGDSVGRPDEAIAQARGLDEAWNRAVDRKTLMAAADDKAELAARSQSAADEIENALNNTGKRSKVLRERIGARLDEARTEAAMDQAVAQSARDMIDLNVGKMAQARNPQPPRYAVAQSSAGLDKDGKPTTYAPAPAMERLADKVYDPQMETRSPASLVRDLNRQMRAGEMQAMSSQAARGDLSLNRNPQGTQLSAQRTAEIEAAHKADLDNLMEPVIKGDLAVVNSWKQAVNNLNSRIPGIRAAIQARVLRVMANNEANGFPERNDSRAMREFANGVGIGETGSPTALDRLGAARARAETQFPLGRMDAAAERMADVPASQRLRDRHRPQMMKEMFDYEGPPYYQGPTTSNATRKGYDEVFGRPRGDDRRKIYNPFDFFDPRKQLSEENYQAAALWSAPTSMGMEGAIVGPLNPVPERAQQQPAQGNPLMQQLTAQAGQQTEAQPVAPAAPPGGGNPLMQQLASAAPQQPAGPPKMDVAHVQRLLVMLGVPPEDGRVDGVIGPKTRAALEQFAAAAGLSGPDDPRLVKYLEGMLGNTVDPRMVDEFNAAMAGGRR